MLKIFFDPQKAGWRKWLGGFLFIASLVLHLVLLPLGGLLILLAVSSKDVLDLGHLILRFDLIANIPLTICGWLYLKGRARVPAFVLFLFSGGIYAVLLLFLALALIGIALGYPK